MTPAGEVIDLFAGPGGWSEGLRQLGLSEIGYEIDKAACDTARAAGHERVQEDVSRVDLGKLRAALIVAGLIASPPCQAWSRAGKRQGILDQPRIFRFIDALIEIAKTDPESAWLGAMLSDDAEHNRAAWHDDRSQLVLEPVRWALELRPRWIACEQVPDVLPFWERFAVLLRALGYSVWTGVLSSERYGVPQTRARAILMASLDRPVTAPPATHHAYNAREIAQDGLFELDLLPWVSMAEALGWTPGSAGYRLARGAGMLERHGPRRDTPDLEPAPVITSKARTATWVYRNGNQANAAERPVDAPAPTVAFGNARADVRWLMQSNQTSDTAAKQKATRPVESPSLTLTTNTRLYNWVTERPATTVQGDPRIAEPGHRDRGGGVSQFAGESVRVAVQEAAVLQSFRPDYPWQGSRTKQYEQVGNAIPPPLAVAVIGHLLGIEWQHINREAYRSERAA